MQQWESTDLVITLQIPVISSKKSHLVFHCCQISKDTPVVLEVHEDFSDTKFIETVLAQCRPAIGVRSTLASKTWPECQPQAACLISVVLPSGFSCESVLFVGAIFKTLILTKNNVDERSHHSTIALGTPPR